jgi:hypothetical protein
VASRSVASGPGDQGIYFVSLRAAAIGGTKRLSETEVTVVGQMTKVTLF